jgi:hypothetical protein
VLPRKFFRLFCVLLYSLFLSCSDSPKPNGIIALLTDYGTGDAYVGALSGAILRINPKARLVTITHEVPSYDIREASYLLASAAVEFPPGTVFVAVVDPGVGSSRRAIALETNDGKYFVGPDNGIFTDVIRSSGVKRAHSIDNVLWMRPTGVSTTFHGRDVFGPAAAQLSKGASVQEAGGVLAKLVQFQRTEASFDGQNFRSQILHRDHYGNLLTNIPAEMAAKAGLKKGMQLTVRNSLIMAGASFENRYSAVDSGKFVIVINSQGRLEIARNLASAGDSLKVRAGDEIVISTTALR